MRSVFCGNLNYKLTEADLAKVFQPYGQVDSARIILDRDFKSSAGYGFVDMATEAEAVAAIAGLNGTLLMGRTLRCSPASRSY